MAKAPDAALKKVGEEAAEFIMACKDAEPDASADDRARVVGEAADVWFHMLVAMSRYDVGGADVLAELARREDFCPALTRRPRDPNERQRQRRVLERACPRWRLWPKPFRGQARSHSATKTGPETLS